MDPFFFAVFTYIPIPLVRVEEPFSISLIFHAPFRQYLAICFFGDFSSSYVFGLFG